MKLLFVCNQGMHRSKTAEHIFAKDFNTKSAGLYNNRVTPTMIEWADIVITMTDEQRRELSVRFPKQYLQKRIVSLDIPDVYGYGESRLKILLREKMKDLLPTLTTP